MTSGVVAGANPTSNTTIEALGDNLYDEQSFGNAGSAAIRLDNANNTKLIFQADGNQTIQDTNANRTAWQGVALNSTGASSDVEFTIPAGGNVMIGGNANASTQQTGVSLVSSNGVAQLNLNPNGALNIQFPATATNDGNIGLLIQRGNVVGGGTLNIGLPLQPFHGLAMLMSFGPYSVNLTGPVSIYTDGVSVFAQSVGQITLDASGQSSPNVFISQGGITSIPARGISLDAVFAIADRASLTMKHASVTMQTSPAYDQSAAFSLDTTGKVVLDDVQIVANNRSNNSSISNAAGGIDLTHGNVNASKLSITTQNDDVYGIAVDSYDQRGLRYSVLLCGADPGTSTTCPAGALQNSITTYGARAHGIFMANSNRTLEMANTAVTTNGVGAAAVAVAGGAVTFDQGNVLTTNGQNGAGLLYEPAFGSTINIRFDPSTVVAATAANSYGFLATGNASVTLDGCTSSCAQIASAQSTTAGGVPFDNFRISGANGAAVAAQGGATIALSGVDFGGSAIQLAAGSWLAAAGGNGSAGTIQFTGGTKTGGKAIWAADDGTLDFNDSTSDASGSLIKIDAGTTGGRLDLSGRTSALTAGLIESGGTGTNGGTVELGANSLVLDGAAAGSATFSGSIEGSGGLTMNGSGTQVLSGSTVFRYTGATNLLNGTLAVANVAVGRDFNGNWKNFNLGAGGTLDISANGGSFQLGGISGIGAVQTSGAGLSSDLLVAGSGSQSFSGTIAGSGGLTMLGSGVQTLSGSNVFNYSGVTTIAAGTLAVGGAGGSNVANKMFSFDHGTNTGGTLDVSNGGFTLGGIDARNAATTTAAIHLGNVGSPATLTLAGSGTYSFQGAISGYGDVVKQGSGNQTLSGMAAFGNSGQTILQGGTLLIRNISDPSQLNHTFQLDGGWLDLSDATFDSSGASANQWVNLHVTDGINAARSGIIGGNDQVSLGQNGADQFEAAQLGGDGTVPSQQGVFIVKSGSNTLTLTGHNHYVGNTRIEGGTLKVSEDDNLGDTAFEREVVLNGGNLDIAGSFTSQRQIQLQRDGQVQVDGAGTSTTWDSIAGAGTTLTKSGAGTLTLSGISTLAHAAVQGGSLDLGRAMVDATGTPGTAAITQQAGTSVSLSGGTVASTADGIVANDTSTLNLSNGTTMTSGSGYALYRVLSGTGTLNASQGQSLAGTLEADGAGSQLAINLSQGSTYTGVPTLRGGATATLSTDSSSTWNLTGDATLARLDNRGTINFDSSAQTGSAMMSGAIAKAAGATSYLTLNVSGDSTAGGTVKLHTELNDGGRLTNQHTDRLLIAGNVSGAPTTLSVTTSGSGANTHTSPTNQAIPTEGISLVQVGGKSSATAFTLAGGYVSAPGSAYQYRLFAFGPGSYALPDASQSLLPNGKVPQWDYRLQTSYVDSSGRVQPGPQPDGRPAIVPQGTTYLTAPLALQNYEATVIDNLYRRLGEIRDGLSGPSGQSEEVFARVIASTDGKYHSNRSFQEYGYDFSQDIEAIQFGGNWLRRKSADHDLRLGAAITLGHTSVNPQAATVESSSASIDTYNLALTGTWQNRDGWYADGVASAGRYSGTVSSSQGKAGIAANGFDLSAEGGRSFTLPKGIEIEPHVQILAQSLFFDSQDNDGISAKTSDLLALTGRVGVRISMPVQATESWKPYLRVDLQHTWMNSPKVTLSGQAFEVGSAGSAIQVGLGASGMVTPRLFLYGELDRKQRLGYGLSSIGATLGLRYAF